MPEAFEFDWDQQNTRHLKRHKVTPEEFEEIILSDHLELDYQFERGEERFKVLGMTRSGRILIVVWTLRGEIIRAVTAYRASRRHERLLRESWGEEP